VALLATCLLAVIIAWATLTPNPPTPDLDSPHADKIYHVVAFAVLVLPTAVLYARSLTWILPLACGFGIAIELVQPYTGRALEVADILADLVGCGVGTAVGLTLRAIVRRHT
jgi:VanZ family protein